MALPFDLDAASYDRESALAGAGLDYARALLLPEDEGDRLAATWDDFVSTLGTRDWLLVLHWLDVFRPVPVSVQDISIAIRYRRRQPRPPRGLVV